MMMDNQCTPTNQSTQTRFNLYMDHTKCLHKNACTKCDAQNRQPYTSTYSRMTSDNNASQPNKRRSSSIFIDGRQARTIEAARFQIWTPIEFRARFKMARWSRKPRRRAARIERLNKTLSASRCVRPYAEKING